MSKQEPCSASTLSTESAVLHALFYGSIFSVERRNFIVKTPFILTGKARWCPFLDISTIIINDVYTALETMTDGECTFPNLPPTLMLIVAYMIEAYYLARHFMISSWWGV